MKIMRCPSCEGYGWFEGDEFDQTEQCTWCAGVGYVYRGAAGDSVRPPADYEKVAQELETLERQRLRAMGYQGEAKKPWQQNIRKDTRLGRNPYAADESADDD